MASLMEFAHSNATPFLKWAGGKGQLLHEYGKSYPSDFGRYFEPFLGGGAVFFNLYSKGAIKSALLSDTNRDLINCYVTIRDHLDELVKELEDLQRFRTNEEYFYNNARPEFNSIRLKTGEEGHVRKAALLIFMNKTCFNGLYRVNSKGQFNVPWGRYKNPRIIDRPNLKEVHRVLNDDSVSVKSMDYHELLRKVKKNDFAYFDPPYQPSSQTSSFTKYTQADFTLTEQEELSELYDVLSTRGALLMLSNSPKVLHLYEGKGYRIKRVKATRAINSVGSKRGPVEEILVMNYGKMP